MEVGVYEGAAWLYAGHIQCLHRAFKRHVGADCPEAAEVMNPNQQGGSLTHGSHIQLPDERQKQGTFFYGQAAEVYRLLKSTFAGSL